MSDTQTSDATQPRYLRIAGLTFAVVIALLLAGYFLVLRYDFRTLYGNLDIEEASLIAAELDRQEVRYRVGENGTSILVPQSEIEAVRLAVYSADGPTRGLTGFELFNESEMGLTDFAQKIKFQRAIQGELGRTIMMLEGVKKARVHVAIPERSVFRSQQTAPKAAVTLMADAGHVFSDASILGIQRTVASSIPGLSLRHVTVVDHSGQIISRTSEIGDAPVIVEKNDSMVYAMAPQTEPAALYKVANASVETLEKSDAAPIKAAEAEPEVTTIVSKAPIDVEETVAQLQKVVGTPKATTSVKSKPQAALPAWVLYGSIVFALLVLLIGLAFHRSRNGLSSEQRDAFATELSQSLRAQSSEVVHG